MRAGPSAAVVTAHCPIRPGPARGGDRVPMSTYQDTNPISPDALVLGYQVRDHHLPSWTVLHDRLAPGTEHRMAHVLAGPGGLVVATVLPVTDPLRRYGRQLYTGQVPLQQWFTTRWWEVQALQAAVTARLAHWPWPGLPDCADARRRCAAGRPGAARDVAVPARPGRGADPGQRHGPGLCPGGAGVAGPARGRRARRRGPGGLPTRRSAGERAGRRLTHSPPGGRRRHNALRATTDSLRTALPSAPEGHRRPALPAAVAGRSRRSGRTRWPGTAPAIPRRSARPVCRHRRGPVPAGRRGQVLGLAAGPQVVQSGAAGLTGLARVAAAECLRHAAPEDGG